MAKRSNYCFIYFLYYFYFILWKSCLILGWPIYQWIWDTWVGFLLKAFKYFVLSPAWIISKERSTHGYQLGYLKLNYLESGAKEVLLPLNSALARALLKILALVPDVAVLEKQWKKCGFLQRKAYKDLKGNSHI